VFVLLCGIACLPCDDDETIVLCSCSVCGVVMFCFLTMVLLCTRFDDVCTVRVLFIVMIVFWAVVVVGCSKLLFRLRTH